MNLNDIPIYPCVQCGFCCTVGICYHGAWNTRKTQCRFLTEEDKCARYDEIKGDWVIGFGKGCSSPLFNDRRRKKMKLLY